MYVGFAEYSETAFAGGVSEEDYPRFAAVADTVVDDWTYGRVGEAAERGEELPRSIVNLYAAVVSNMPDMVEDSTSATESAVTSFSNGVDSYGFEHQKDLSEKLELSLGWLIDALPPRWTSACIYPVGRCHCRDYHAC